MTAASSAPQQTPASRTAASFDSSSGGRLTVVFDFAVAAPGRRLIVALAVAFALAAGPAGAAAQEPADTFALDPLVVTATPVPLPASALGRSVTVLDGDDLRARGVIRVSDALREAPGITLARNGSYGAVTTLFMRGGESDYVQVMVDGVPINQPGGSVDLASLTVEAVDRIEIVRGPSSALYGSDAVAGVVNVITRRGGEGEGVLGSALVRTGSYGRLDAVAEARGGGESASWGLSLADRNTDGILDFNNTHDNTVLHGNAEIRPDDRTTARISTRLTSRDYHFPTDFAGAVVDENQSTFSEEATVGAELARSLAAPAGEPGSVRLRAFLSLHDQESGTDDLPDGPADTLGFYGFQSLNAMRRSAADVRATWTASERVSLTGGAELEHQRLRSFTESLSQFGGSTDRSANTRTNQAAYLHAIFGAGAVDLNAGLRAEDNGQYGSFFTWQIGAAWEVRPGTLLRASAGRGIKEPTFFEAFATGFAVGNPDLDPERSRSWEAGVEQEVGSAVRLEATWFDQSFRDLIQFTLAPPNPGDPSFYNVAAADSRGLEVAVEGAVGPVTVTGEWTHLLTEVRDSGFDEGPGAAFVEGEPLLRRPENEAGLTVRGRLWGRIQWSASVFRVGERADRDFSGFPAEPVTLDGYTLFDASVEWSVLEGAGSAPGLDLLLRAENLTDETYQEVWGFPAPGRALTVGGRLRTD